MVKRHGSPLSIASDDSRKLGPYIPASFSTCPRIRPLRLRNLFGWPFCDNLTTAIATLRAEIDNPIRILDYIEIILDHDHRVARFDKLIEHVVRLRLSPCSVQCLDAVVAPMPVSDLTS